MSVLFTRRARMAWAAATAAARREHQHMGTEHVLLALLEAGGVAATALQHLGVNIQRVEEAVARVVRDGQRTWASSEPVMTQRARQALNRAIEESRQLGIDWVGTEHLLIGLVQERECVAAQALRNLGLVSEQIREEVLKTSGDSTGKEESGLGAPPETPSTQSHDDDEAVRMVNALLHELRRRKEHAVRQGFYEHAAVFRDLMVAAEQIQARLASIRQDDQPEGS